MSVNWVKRPFNTQTIVTVSTQMGVKRSKTAIDDEVTLRGMVRGAGQGRNKVITFWAGLLVGRIGLTGSPL